MRPFRSANTRVLCGSTALAVAVGGFGGACAAQPGGGALTQPAAYHGPYLTWAGKTGSPETARQPDTAPPVAAGATQSEFAAWPAPAPGAPRLHSLAAAAYVAPSHAYAPAARPKPAAVAAYIAPRRLHGPLAAPATEAVAAYVAPPALHTRHTAQMALSAPPAPTAPAQVLAQNDTTAAPAPATNPLGQTGVHYYSLHREYGLTPDQVVTPKERPMVLIGPPENPPAQKSDDANDGSDKHGGAQGADE